MNQIEHTGTFSVLATFLVVGIALPIHPAAAQGTLQIVTTLPDYAWIAQEIAGELATVEAISRGDQDAHFVRPKPSYQVKLRDADLFVTTGLDLELWVPTLLDAAGNRQVLEGGPGFVAAWPGIELLDKPSMPAGRSGA